MDLKEENDMMILGEHYDEFFGLDEYDNYNPFEGEENEEEEQ